MKDDGYDDSNEYAGKSEQVIRITQPITVATRDNIYKNMATQRTRANLYKAGYKRTKTALQKQQKINAAMSTTLAAQNPTVTTQTITTTSPKVVQPKTVKTQVTQNPNTTTQVVQAPTTPGTAGAGNVPNQTSRVRYIRVPASTTRTAYNLQSTTTTAVAPVAAGRGGGGPQGVQIKQEPASPGNVATPKATSTIVRKGRGRGQNASTISVVEAVPEENEYIIEELEEELEGSVSDPMELYQILAELSGSEEDLDEGLEPEIEPPI